MMTHDRFDYVNLMHQRGFRVTPQRQIILDAICAGGGHTTPEEIYARVQQKSAAINQATVYRTLDFLCRLGLVVSADVGTTQKVYEIAGDAPHHHLICKNCKQVQNIPHESVAPFLAQLETRYGFTVDMDHMILFGLCAACREQKTD